MIENRLFGDCYKFIADYHGPQSFVHTRSIAVSSSIFSSEGYSSIITTLRNHFLRYGYLPQETRIVDDADLFLTKAGDQVIDRMFIFQRHGRELAFRPEFTTLAAKQYASDETLHGEVVRWQFAGPTFSIDEKTTNAPSLSFGAELIGVDDQRADEEIICALLGGLLQLELTNPTLVISDVGLITAVLNQFKIDLITQRFFIQHLSVLHDMGLGTFMEKLRDYLPDSKPGEEQNHDETAPSIENLINSGTTSNIGVRTPTDIARRLAGKHKRASEYDRIEQAAKLLKNILQQESNYLDIASILDRLAPVSQKIKPILVKLQRLIDLLKIQAPNVEVLVQSDLALSWEYYTGLVFEVHAEGRMVASGGRYDDLIGLMGHSSGAPAVGFACDINQLHDLVGKTITTPQRVFSIGFSVEAIDDPQTTSWVSRLRDSGVNVEMVFNVSNQMQRHNDFRIEEGKLIVNQTARHFALDEIEQLVDFLNSGMDSINEQNDDSSIAQ